MSISVDPRVRPEGQTRSGARTMAGNRQLSSGICHPASDEPTAQAHHHASDARGRPRRTGHLAPLPAPEDLPDPPRRLRGPPAAVLPGAAMARRGPRLWIGCVPVRSLGGQPPGTSAGSPPLPPTSARRLAPGGRAPGISVHHRLVDPRDARILDGVPCVSSDLVLIDLARSLEEAELETVLVAAESLGLLKRHRLAELIAADGGTPGISKLRRILALEPAITRSELEGLVLPICRLAGIERPRVELPGVRTRSTEAPHRRLRLARSTSGLRSRQPAFPRRLGAGGRGPGARSAARPRGMALPPVRPRPLGRRSGGLGAAGSAGW